MNFLEWYLSVGASIWIIFFIRDAFDGFSSFRNAAIVDIFRGLIGSLLWPLLIITWRDKK